MFLFSTGTASIKVSLAMFELKEHRAVIALELQTVDVLH
jgi:hypothetical protein